LPPAQRHHSTEGKAPPLCRRGCVIDVRRGVDQCGTRSSAAAMPLRIAGRPHRRHARGRKRLERRRGSCGRAGVGRTRTRGRASCRARHIGRAIDCPVAPRNVPERARQIAALATPDRGHERAQRDSVDGKDRESRPARMATAAVDKLSKDLAFKANVDAVTRDYICEPRIGGGGGGAARGTGAIAPGVCARAALRESPGAAPPTAPRAPPRAPQSTGPWAASAARWWWSSRSRRAAGFGGRRPRCTAAQAGRPEPLVARRGPRRRRAIARGGPPPLAPRRTGQTHPSHFGLAADARRSTHTPQTLLNSIAPLLSGPRAAALNPLNP
jgi:hypothetical protein